MKSRQKTTAKIYNGYLYENNGSRYAGIIFMIHWLHSVEKYTSKPFTAIRKYRRAMGI